MRRSASARCGAPLGRTCSGVARAMRAVVVGAGSIGQRHLKNLLALGHEVAAVLDPDPARLDEIRPLVGGGCRLATDERDAFAGDANAAVICSPTHRHLDQARAAL